ncbi:MAG: hypothetical protein ACJ73D_00015 [Pyrinomonadaceae bacterium]
MSLCTYCGKDFGAATSVVCLHCGAPLGDCKKQPDPPYRRTKTRLSYNGRRIMELLECTPSSVSAPNARTIATALQIDWAEIHMILEQLHDDGLVTFTVDGEHGSKYLITERGKSFL